MLKKLFEPKSIAVIGASRNPGKLGHVVVKNLVEHKFRGKVFPINPNGGTLLKKKVYRNVSEIPEPVDLAIVIVPAGIVAEVVRECGEKKIKVAVIISAGFGESGKEGRQRERQLLKIAKQYKIRILGPNCLGLIVPHLRFNASFAGGMPSKGSVAVLSQSGAMAVAINDMALTSGLGFSALVSLGNKADINEDELVAYFGKDKSTEVIIMYLENLATGRSFLRTIKRVSRVKPVVILKPGKSVRAIQAVASHTGAIAGSHKVQNASLEAAGAVVVTSLQELFMNTSIFRKHREIVGPNVAVVTNAGGPGILATDEISVMPNLSLATISGATLKKLNAILPEASAKNNPVDVLGDASADRYQNTLKILLADPGIDSVIVLVTPQAVTRTAKIADVVIRYQRRYKHKPIVSSFIGGGSVVKGREKLKNAHELQFSYPEHAVHALEELRKFSINVKKVRSFPEIPSRESKRLVPVLGKDAERIVKPYINGVVPSVLTNNSDEAIKRVKRIGYPVVVKIVAKQFVHKYDKGAVALNISTEDALRKKLELWKKQMQLRFKKGEGFYMQPYKPGILEVIIGAKRDETIGPYIICGLGGVYIESIKSASITPIPLTRSNAKELLYSGLLGKVIQSDRGKDLPVDLLLDMLIGVSRLMTEKPSIADCELNPVIVSPGRADVVDIRIISYA